MFSSRLRWLLPIVGLVAAIASFAAGRWAFGLAYLAAALLFGWGSLKFPSIGPALDAFRKGDMARVRELLQRVRGPDRLGPRDRAYYDWMQGVLASDDGDVPRARELLARAAEGPLRSDNDRSIIEFQLAGLALRQGDVAAARALLASARARKARAEVEELIAGLERQLPPEG
ncbi:MAG TPA: hypothetical protein VFQ38_03180 [Longimicrobiales bacterium]|nr:hypothetical protein [Longimicrobiales bacterium]